MFVFFQIELSFAAGQKIEIFGEMDEDGFFNVSVKKM